MINFIKNIQNSYYMTIDALKEREFSGMRKINVYFYYFIKLLTAKCKCINHEKTNSMLSYTFVGEIINGMPAIVETIWCAECIENKQYEAELSREEGL